MTRMVCGAVACVVLSAGPAFAQTAAAAAPAEKFFLNVSAGGQLTTVEVKGTASATVYNQTALANTSREVSGGPLFDLTLGVPVHGKLALAGTVSLRKATSDAALSASVPHPLFSDAPRSVSTTVAGMTHQETWFGALAAYTLSSTGRRSITIMAGPMVVAVKHDSVTGIAVTEGSSATSPTVTATVGGINKTFWGYTIGTDVRVMLTKTVGVGGFIRYTAAPGNITGVESVTLGGLQAGAGIRFSLK